jgi:hypothetical protein
MESNRNQELKGMKPKTQLEWNQCNKSKSEIDWNNIETGSNQKLNPKPRVGEMTQTEIRNRMEWIGIKLLPRVAMYQIEIRNRMESNRIQALKGSPTETTS